MRYFCFVGEHNRATHEKRNARCRREHHGNNGLWDVGGKNWGEERWRRMRRGRKRRREEDKEPEEEKNKVKEEKEEDRRRE